MRSIVILGGGTAGWMVAAKLSRHFERQPVNITVIESSAIGSIGVGEATLPSIRQYFRDIGLHEADMMRVTQATVKLGIEFPGWAGEGTTFFHPFGLFGTRHRNIPFHQYWAKMRLAGEPVSLGDYSVCTALAKANAFRPPPQNSTVDFGAYDWALHFDASLFAKTLRTIATESFGVKWIDAKLLEVKRRAEDGFIESLVLEDGQTISGEFFVDCTGLRALLLGEALGVGFEDWTSMLPCDRAVAIPSALKGPLSPYTRSSARKAGWQWRIPLQHRVGNGYVYSSRHISDDEAVHDLTQSLEGEALAEPNLIRYTTGHRKKFWEKNCVAVGLSAGFLEPLESTSIMLIQSAAQRIVDFFPDVSCDTTLADEFNIQTRLEYERVRDFVIMHYYGNKRFGEPLWDECRAMAIPDLLAQRIRMFRRAGALLYPNAGPFVEPSWLSIFAGLGVHPERYDPGADYFSTDELRVVFSRIQQDVIAAAKSAPKHEEFLARNCAAPKPEAMTK